MIEDTIKDALTELLIMKNNMVNKVVKSRTLWGYYFGRIEGFFTLYRLIGRYMNREDQDEYMNMLNHCRKTLKEYE